MDENTFLIITGIIGGFFIGGLCGAVPLAIAIVKKKLIWGIASMILCVACGIIFAVVLKKPAFLSFSAAEDRSRSALPANVYCLRPDRYSARSCGRIPAALG